RFDAGVEVTPDLLKTAGVVRSLRHPVKILGDGELTRSLTVRAHAFSRRATEIIQAAGGTVVVIGGEPAEPAPARKKATRTRAEPEPEPEAAAEAEAEEPAAEAEPEADAGGEPAEAEE